MDVDRHERAMSHFPVGCAAGILPAAVAALFAVRQVLVHFADCEIGVNSGANGMFLLIFVWPPLTLALTLVFGLVFAAVRRSGKRSLAVLTALAAVVVTAVVAPYLLVPLLVSPDYPTTGCS